MRIRDLLNADLNLLVHLKILLEEEHIGRAARRAGLSDSAMSRRLAQLRELFGDQLLVGHGRGVTRSKRGTALLPRLNMVLSDIETHLLSPQEFDASKATGTWTLATTDSIHLLIAGELLTAVRAAAPGLVLRLVGPQALFHEGLNSDEVALGIGLRPRSNLYHVRTLFEQSFLTLARPDHPGLCAHNPPAMTLDAFCAAPHGLISPRGRPGSFVDDALARVGRERDVVTIVEHFSLAAMLIQRNQLLVTLPSLIAKVLVRDHGLITVVPPVDLPRLPATAIWHPRYHHDPAHIWLRDQVTTATRRMLAAFEPEPSQHE